MQVHIQNDGPVTIEIESPIKETIENTNKKKQEKILQKTVNGDAECAA